MKTAMISPLDSKTDRREIRPHLALYIKLGHAGVWEDECVIKEQILRFGSKELSYEDCLAGRWDKVTKLTTWSTTDKGAITNHVRQIQDFYRAGQDVLWVTFHGNYLWWCFAERKVVLHSSQDGSAIRKVIGKWSNTDIKGNQLFLDTLRGSLLSMQGFRGTICRVKEFDYLVNKINGKTPSQIVESRAAHDAFVSKVEQLVRNLRWKDFELLVDLIFREAGWKRLGPIGKTQKSIDLELLSPLLNEIISVQVKSEASLSVYNEYAKRLAEMDEYARSFFVVHSPDAGLAKELESQKSKSSYLTVLGPRQVAQLCVDYGLSEWVMAKAE
jgi:hypothetical protein